MASIGQVHKSKIGYGIYFQEPRSSLVFFSILAVQSLHECLFFFIFEDTSEHGLYNGIGLELNAYLNKLFNLENVFESLVSGGIYFCWEQRPSQDNVVEFIANLLVVPVYYCLSSLDLYTPISNNQQILHIERIPTCLCRYQQYITWVLSSSLLTALDNKLKWMLGDQQTITAENTQRTDTEAFEGQIQSIAPKPCYHQPPTTVFDMLLELLLHYTRQNDLSQYCPGQLEDGSIFGLFITRLWIDYLICQENASLSSFFFYSVIANRQDCRLTHDISNKVTKRISLKVTTMDLLMALTPRLHSIFK
ncbi:hypothetical protein BCR42DRAFT_392477 [Absidia repens]|uniref:Uncharacterized protein n=1 Tax=Absidia repens TaxID=90262 RepID=A0A1X2IH90_9FUNG|nr:hypothetical protein BCR42DRAFT_392477 [Absidia repens]